MNKNFILAVATLVGAIVGLGMFGIPYTASKAGFFVGIGYIVVLGFVMLILHLIYGEVVERTKEKHRLTGYAEKYLGAKWKKVVGPIIILSIYSALLAYIIVGGKFLALIFPGFASPFIFSIVFWLVLSIAVWRGIRTVAGVELAMAGLLLLLVIILFAFGAGSINNENFYSFELADFFLPYGVVLFAFAGILAIPEVRELIKMDGRQYKKAIILGTLIPMAVYILFTVLVVGISGTGTSHEALAGLSGILSSGAIRIGAVFGILALATSYLVLGLNLKHTFEYDWKTKKVFAGAMVTVVPILLFIGGIEQFIEIISFSGAVFGAIFAVLIILIYKKTLTHGDKEPGYTLSVPKLLLWGLVGLFALGGVYEIIYLIR
jgi:tyrosine-specific transport protein